MILIKSNGKHHIEVRLNEQEYNALLKWKEWLGCSTLVSVIRMWICSGIVYKFDYSTHIKAVTEIGKTGATINQIAHKVNITNSFYFADIEELQNQVDALEDLVTDFLKEKEHCEKEISEMFICES